MIKCVLSRQVVACESAAPATNDFLITYCFCSHVLPILILIPRYCSLITSTTKSFSSWWWCYKLYKVSGIGVSNGEGDGNSGGDDQKHHNTGFNVHLHLSSPSSCLSRAPIYSWWKRQNEKDSSYHVRKYKNYGFTSITGSALAGLTPQFCYWTANIGMTGPQHWQPPHYFAFNLFTFWISVSSLAAWVGDHWFVQGNLTFLPWQPAGQHISVHL